MARVEDSNRVQVASIRCRWERFVMEIFGETVASMCSDQVLGLELARGQHRLELKACRTKTNANVFWVGLHVFGF